MTPEQKEKILSVGGPQHLKRVETRQFAVAMVNRFDVMDRWWTASGDDWPIPEHICRAFAEGIAQDVLDLYRRHLEDQGILPL